MHCPLYPLRVPLIHPLQRVCTRGASFSSDSQTTFSCQTCFQSYLSRAVSTESLITYSSQFDANLSSTKKLEGSAIKSFGEGFWGHGRELMWETRAATLKTVPRKLAPRKRAAPQAPGGKNTGTETLLGHIAQGRRKACLQLTARIQSQQTPHTITVTNPWEASRCHDFTRRTCLPHQSLSVRGHPVMGTALPTHLLSPQKWMENTPTQFVSCLPAPCQPVSPQSSACSKPQFTGVTWLISGMSTVWIYTEASPRFLINFAMCLRLLNQKGTTPLKLKLSTSLTIGQNILKRP